MILHSLKIRDEFYQQVRRGSKTFEVRKNDRGFKAGDLVTFNVLSKAMNATGDVNTYTDGEVYQITYVLTHDQFPDGIAEGYCVFGIKRMVKE
jgi:Uncharacterized conserved protein